MQTLPIRRLNSAENLYLSISECIISCHKKLSPHHETHDNKITCTDDAIAGFLPVEILIASNGLLSLSMI